MGLFGGGSSQPSKSDELIEKQYQQKKKALYTQRLDIIKSQGGQTWTPNRDK
jgi:hypothetical protein